MNRINKRTKRMVSLFLVVIISILIPLSSLSIKIKAATYDYNGFIYTYTQTSATKCTVTSITKNSSYTEIEMPDMINGLTVTKIIPGTTGTNILGYNASNSSSNSIERIVLPSNLEVIGSYAFAYFPNITEIDIVDSVTTLEGNCFSNCDKLSSVKIGSGVVNYGTGNNFPMDKSLKKVYFNCNTIPTAMFRALNTSQATLTEVQFGPNVRYIESNAFYSQRNLSNAIFEEGLITIGADTFNACNLGSITLPSTVVSIGNRSFSDAGTVFKILNRDAGITQTSVYSPTLGTLSSANIIYGYTNSSAETYCNMMKSNGKNYTFIPLDDENSIKVKEYEDLLEKIRVFLPVDLNEKIVPKIEEIKKELDDTKKALEAANDEVTKLQGENATLKETVVVLEKEISDKETTIVELQNMVADLNKQLNDSNVTITEKETIINNLQTQITNLTTQVTNLTQQVTDLTVLINQIKAELGVDDNEEIIPAIQELKRRYNNLKNLYDQLVIENSSNATTILTLTERITELESLITILEKDAQDNADTIENLQDRVNELTSEVESYKLLIESIKTLLGANSNEEIIHKIQELLDGLSALQKDYENLSQSYEDYKTVAQEKITELQERISSLEKELADGNIELEVVKDQLAAALIQISDLTSLIDEIKRELGVDSNEEIIPAIQELKRKYEELKTKYDALVLDNNTNNTTIITLTERITELENIITQLESDAITNAATIKDLQDRINELTTKVNEYETLIDSIKSLLEVTTNDEILPKIQLILAQLEALKNDYSNLSDGFNEYKVNAINKIEELTIKISQLEQELASKDIELDSIKRELADALAQITDLRTLVDLIKSELGVTDDSDIIPAIKALKDRIAGLESQVTDLQNKLNSANSTIEDLTNDKNEYIERLEKMKDLVEADNTDEIESKIKDMKDLISKYEEKINQLEKEKEDHEKEITDQLKEIQDLKDALKGDTQDLLNRIKELEEQIKALEIRNSNLSDQVDSLNQSISDLTTENTELKKQIIEIQTQLDIANSTIEELQKKVIDLTVENELLKDENAKLKAENEELKKHECPSNEDLLKEIEELNKEIENLKKNQSTNNSTVTVPDNSVVLTPTTDTDNIIEQTDNKVSAESGWELNTRLNTDKWTDEIDMGDLLETTGTFTFFTGKDLAKTFSSYVEKTVVYARKKSEPSNVYVCSFNLDKGIASYTSPTGSMSSNTKGVTFVYDESNTKVVNTTGKVTFKVDGDFGVIGKKGIYYKVVAVQNDFDPDGSWKEVVGNSFSIEVNEQVRVYIKYVDNYGNYTVSKTTVLDSSKRLDVPVLLLNKTVYLDNSYKLQLDVETNGNKIMYTSSDNSIATVSENGLIKAKKNGKAKVVCTVYDKDGTLIYKYEVSVTIKESKDKTLSLKKNYSASGTDDVILQSYKLIRKGKSTKLNVKADKDAKVMYVTSDKAVATVSSKGIVTGKAKGSADITVVVYQNDKFYTYVVKVRVTDGTKDKDKEQYLK